MTRIIIALLAGSCAVASATTAEARTRPGFEIAAELFDYAYRERLDGETIVRDDGTFGGGALRYVETIGGSWFLRGSLSAAVGSVDYRSDEDDRIDNVTQSIGQLELHVGRDFILGNGASVTAFTGLGSRALIDESGGEESDTGLAGYDREISYAYVPVGAAARIPVGRRATLAFSAQYNWIVGGEAESKFSDVDPVLPDVELNLDGGHGLEAMANVEIPIGRRAISFGPFLRHWKVDRSDPFVLVDPEGSGEAIEFFEPKNRTTEVGVRLAFGF
jgi:hypothetical protein